LLTVSGKPRRITVPNFVKIGRSVTEILQFFKFSRWPPPPSWIFEIAKFYSLLGSRVTRRISKPNFVKIGREDIKIFRLLKMVAAAIMDLRNHEFLFAAGICGAQTHHCTKFRQNRSFHCGDIAIFLTFRMAAAAILDF